MFKRHIAVTSIVLIAVAAAAMTALLTHHDDDLSLEDIGRNEFEAPALGGLRQERRGVRRDILHSQNKALRTVLFSEEADIVLLFDKKDASEQLKYLYGYSQESLGYDTNGAPTQLVRYFQADSGAYNHKQHQVDLADVAVARYEVAGHELPEDISTLAPLSQATAHTATAVLSPTLQVEAEQVTASLDASQVSLVSHHASYDGLHLKLWGDARVQSPKVAMQAQEIILALSGPSSKLPFDTAVLSGDVVITLEDGAQIACQQVDIDSMRGIAVFTPQPGQYVRWQQPVKGEAAGTVFLCSLLTARFDPALASDDKPSLLIKDVIAEGDILIVQDGAWRATGDVVTFKNMSSEGALAPGMVTLLALHNDRPCTIQTPTGAHLNAARITCDTAQHIITLSGVVAHQGSAVRLENQGDVVIHMNQNGGSGHLATLTADGDTVIAMASPDGAKVQKLVSHGPIHVDHINKRATISSPRDAKGAVARSQQVHFSDGIAEMHADGLVIDYAVAADQISPSHLVAQGGVCVKGHLTETAQDAVAQYALCDTLEYWPGQQRLLLSAKPGRVAILDRANGLAVSAPAVEMRRDPTTRKATIKGIGDVRFTLLDRDYQRLRERFNLDIVDP